MRAKAYTERKVDLVSMKSGLEGRNNLVAGAGTETGLKSQ